MLVQRAKSGDLHVTQHATWGMSVYNTWTYIEDCVVRNLLTSIALTLFVVSGCSESGGIGVPGSPAWRMSTTVEEQSSYWSSVCAGYGFRVDTAEMAQCIQTENNQSRNRNSQRMQGAIDNYSQERANKRKTKKQ